MDLLESAEDGSLLMHSFIRSFIRTVIKATYTAKMCMQVGPTTLKAAYHQWRRQAWGTGARAPWSLRMHAIINFAAVQTMVVLIFLPSSVSSKLHRQSHQYDVTDCCKKLQSYSFLQT